MGTQTEPKSLDIGTNLLSTTQALCGFMDRQEQTGVNGGKGQTNNQTSEDGTHQILTEKFQHETNMQHQEKIEKRSAKCQFESVSLDGQKT